MDTRPDTTPGPGAPGRLPGGRQARLRGRRLAGEPGVCCEQYRIGGRPGWSLVFEGGGNDGFSPDEVAMCLRPAGEAPELAGYEFRDIGELRDEWRRRCFAAAFDRVRRWAARADEALEEAPGGIPGGSGR